MILHTFRLLSLFFFVQLPVTCFAGSLNFSAGETMNIDSEMSSQESMNLSSGIVFKGSGYLKAPRITITSQKFEFTGTIECDQECIITTQQPFEQKMFKRKGNGKFTFIVNPELGTKAEQSETQGLPSYSPRFESPLKQRTAVEESTIETEQSIPLTIKGLTFHIPAIINTALIDAIKRDDLKQFIEILEQDADLKNNANDLRILLIIAGVCDAFSITEELIKRGAPIDKSYKNSLSPLLAAAYTKNVAFAQLLINAGANVNEYNQDWHTPLHMAAQNNDLEMVNLLVNTQGINLNSTDSQWRTPLMLACFQGHKEIVSILVANKAYVDRRDLKGCIAADYALTKDHKDLIDILYSRTAQKSNASAEKYVEKSILGTIKDEFMALSLPMKIWSTGMVSLAAYFILGDAYRFIKKTTNA